MCTMGISACEKWINKNRWKIQKIVKNEEILAQFFAEKNPEIKLNSIRYCKDKYTYVF